MMAIDAQAVADAVSGCPDVASLSGGTLGEVATYLPGSRVVGVRETGAGVEVRIVARWGRPLPEIGEQVRQKIRPLVGSADVMIVIDEIELPEGSEHEFHSTATPHA